MDDLVIEGNLFVGDSTYITGKWVRERDYDGSQERCTAQAQEIMRLREDILCLRRTLSEAQPPQISMVIERHEKEGLDYVKRLLSAHWTPLGIHVVIAP